MNVKQPYSILVGSERQLVVCVIMKWLNQMYSQITIVNITIHAVQSKWGRRVFLKKNKIILLEGKLRSQEEAELIRRTMEEIDDKFKGIEISHVVIDSKNEALLKKIRETLIKFLLGDRRGFTIIGPASIVKEIKQDPEKIQLLTEDLR